MAIKVYLDEQLRARGITAKELCARVGITEANLSILRSGKAKGVRFHTMNRICYYLQCDVGDILKKRNMLFGAGAAALACLLGGCRLAVPQGAAGQDTLIGGYATWESIPYFSEHFLSGDRSPARLYADWSSTDRPEGAEWRNM